MKKHFPPHLSQLVFGSLDKIMMKVNGLDYDLFIFLIYEAHKSYSLEKKDIIEIEYSKVRKILTSNPNTQSIKSSLQKIGNMILVSNYLQSYGDKENIRTQKPFEIEIVTSENGKSYGFSVKTSEDFLKWFDNPIPKVEVNYDIIFSLKKMAKLLYLFLKDSLGIYGNKNRNVDIEKLKNMMNIRNEEYTNSNFITEIKKSIKDINNNSDINVEYETISKRNLKTGLSEIKSVKFSIKKGKLNNQKQNIIKKSGESIEPTVVETNTSSTKTFEQYIEELVEIEYKKQISRGKNIDNPTGYKNSIRKSLLNNTETKSKFELITLLDHYKSEFIQKIPDDQYYELFLKDGNPNSMIFYFITSDYLLKHNGKIVTESISDTLNLIKQLNNQNIHFNMTRASNLNNRASLINPW